MLRHALIAFGVLVPVLHACGPSCKGGKVASGKYCCWPGQSWSDEREACVGAPKCPTGLEAHGGVCTEPPPACPEGMVGIGATTFYGGTNRSDEVCQECPKVHEVTLPAFCIDRTEVTVEAYKKCVDAGKCTPPKANEEGRVPACNELRPERMRHPVNCIDWKQAAAYCAFMEGRLPTEEEWLLAAGRGEGRRYPWGDAAPGPGLANLQGTDGEHDRPLYRENDGWEFTAPVGSYPRDTSPFGLLDMGGNVSEWTSTEVLEKPLVQGGWYSARLASELELRYRVGAFASLSGPWLGVRCVRSPSR